MRSMKYRPSLPFLKTVNVFIGGILFLGDNKLVRLEPRVHGFDGFRVEIRGLAWLTAGLDVAFAARPLREGSERSGVFVGRAGVSLAGLAARGFSCLAEAPGLRPLGVTLTSTSTST